MQSLFHTALLQRLALVALAAFVLAACGGSSDSPGETAESPDGSALPTLVSLQMGDAACYVVLRDENGEDQMLADFPICEMTHAIGKTVRFTTDEQSVMAASCEGDMDCTDTESVIMITSMQVVE